MRKRLVLGLMALAAAIPGGCTQYAETDTPRVDLNRPDGDVLLVVAIDLSGSFADLMAKDGKAYAFLTRAMDNYFRNAVGGDNRVVIAQLSAAGKEPLLWEGTPAQLRQDFGSAAAFRDFLLAKSHPAGSRIHDGVADAIGYALSDPGVAGGKTKAVLCVLSDFDDNAPEPERSERRLAQALGDFGRKGGVVGFFFVDLPRVAVWRRHLQESGVKRYVCESGIVARPPLPVFD